MDSRVQGVRVQNEAVQKKCPVSRRTHPKWSGLLRRLEQGVVPSRREVENAIDGDGGDSVHEALAALGRKAHAAEPLQREVRISLLAYCLDRHAFPNVFFRIVDFDPAAAAGDSTVTVTDDELSRVFKRFDNFQELSCSVEVVLKSKRCRRVFKDLCMLHRFRGTTVQRLLQLLEGSDLQFVVAFSQGVWERAGELYPHAASTWHQQLARQRALRTGSAAFLQLVWGSKNRGKECKHAFLAAAKAGAFSTAVAVGEHGALTYSYLMFLLKALPSPTTQHCPPSPTTEHCPPLPTTPASQHCPPLSRSTRATLEEISRKLLPKFSGLEESAQIMYVLFSRALELGSCAGKFSDLVAMVKESLSDDTFDRNSSSGSVAVHAESGPDGEVLEEGRGGEEEEDGRGEKEEDGKGEEEGEQAEDGSSAEVPKTRYSNKHCSLHLSNKNTCRHLLEDMLHAVLHRDSDSFRSSCVLNDSFLRVAVLAATECGWHSFVDDMASLGPLPEMSQSDLFVDLCRHALELNKVDVLSGLSGQILQLPAIQEWLYSSVHLLTGKDSQWATHASCLETCLTNMARLGHRSCHVVRETVGVLGPRSVVAALADWCRLHSCPLLHAVLLAPGGCPSVEEGERVIRELADSMEAGLFALSVRYLLKLSRFCLSSQIGMTVACMQEASPDYDLAEASLTGLFSGRYKPPELYSTVGVERRHKLIEWEITSELFWGSWGSVEKLLPQCPDTKFLRSVICAPDDSGQKQVMVPFLKRQCQQSEIPAQALGKAFSLGTVPRLAECLMELVDLSLPGTAGWFPIMHTALDATHPETWVDLCLRYGLAHQERCRCQRASRAGGCLLKKAACRGLLRVVQRLHDAGAATNHCLFRLTGDPDLAADDELKDVQAYVAEAAAVPRGLRSLCRTTVTRHVGCQPGRRDRVLSLPLPGYVHRYLLFEPRTIHKGLQQVVDRFSTLAVCADAPP